MKNDSVIGSVVSAIFQVALVVVAIYYIYHGALAAYDYGYRIFKEPPMSAGEGRTVSVTIAEDTTPKSLGEMLENKGLVRDAKLLVLQYYCSEYRKDIKTGTFELSTAMTAEEMFAVMAAEQEEEEDK